MMLDLSNEVVVITGGGRGIGAAAARRFADLRAKVLIVSRSLAELEQVVDSVSNLAPHVDGDGDGDGGEIVCLCGDVADPGFRGAIFAETAKKWGTATILVNNAAMISVARIEDVSAAEWQRSLDVNISAAFFLSQLFFRQCQDGRKKGSIVNISSLGGLSGVEKFVGFAPYTISKFAIIGMTESLAVEGKDLGIRVNCIAPGAVNTRMLSKAAPQLRTNTEPEDIAKIIIFLAADSESGQISGTTIPVYSNQPASASTD